MEPPASSKGRTATAHGFLRNRSGRPCPGFGVVAGSRFRFFVLEVFVRRLALFLLLLASAPAAAQIQSPAEFLGRPVGEDRHLFDWDQIVSYLDHLAASSGRMELVELGPTTEGRRFVMAVVADEDGIARQAQIRDEVRELYRVDRTGEERAREIAAEGRAILAFSLGIHSTEVGAAQASLEILHRLVSSEDPVAARARERLITLVVPCMNPDGLDLVQGWYAETVGTASEGTRPLELYHPYAGHDNNRDGFFNNLVEVGYWSQVLYRDWLPQMVIDEHQMGPSGPRLFLPPFDDPISPTVHPLVYAQLSAAGQQAVSDLTAQGWTGIATSTIFTAEWPGSVRSTGFWHNMLGVLSEVASARLATPLYFPEGSLGPRGRGLDAYAPRSNFLAPWPGGWWRLRDIVDIEIDLTWSFLRWAGERKEDLLMNFYRMNRDAVRAGRTEPPFAFVVPPDQLDAGSDERIAEILHSGGVELHRTTAPVEFGDHRVDAGALVIRSDQPFRPFVLEMLGRTEYPMIQEDGQTVRPYDVTAWRLSELLGVRTIEVEDATALSGFALVPDDGGPTAAPDFDATRARLAATDLASHAFANAAIAAGHRVGRRPDGDFVVEAPAEALTRLRDAEGAVLHPTDEAGAIDPLRRPRIALYSPWGGSMDEGWTRLVLERYGFALERIRPGEPELDAEALGRRLRARYDVILVPSIDAAELRDGSDGSGRPRMGDAAWPPQYRRGIGADAGLGLRGFAAAGGTVIAISASTPWLVEAMGLPVMAVGGTAAETYAPGTLVRIEIAADSSLSPGMGRRASAYYASGYAFTPQAWPEPTEVVATYARRDLLVAGFLDGADALAGRPAIVQLPVGRGRVILFGFHPQRRAQTEGTFKLLFNALWPAIR